MDMVDVKSYGKIELPILSSFRLSFWSCLSAALLPPSCTFTHSNISARHFHWQHCFGGSGGEGGGAKITWL